MHNHINNQQYLHEMFTAYNKLREQLLYSGFRIVTQNSNQMETRKTEKRETILYDTIKNTVQKMDSYKYSAHKRELEYLLNL